MTNKDLASRRKEKINKKCTRARGALNELQEGFQPIPANDILEQIEDVSIYFRQPTSSAIASD